jgi:hypothetical protein
MTTKNVLLLGRTGVDVDAVHEKLRMPDVQLFAGSDLGDARRALAEARIDHVIMGASIDLEHRLEIVREVFRARDSTTVHMKDRITAKAGFVPFVRAVLGGLGDYAITEAPT